VSRSAPFDDFKLLLQSLATPQALQQLALVAACVGLAWLLTHLFLRRTAAEPRSLWRAQTAVRSLAFPVLALVFVVAVRWLGREAMPMQLTQLVLPILASLVVVRLAARLLRQLFPSSAGVRSLERTFSWVVWGAMVMWVTGLLPALLKDADEIKWTLGGSAVSLRSLIEGAVAGVAVMVAALWASSVIEARLLAPSSVRGSANLSLRKIAANGTRAVLLIVGVLFALTAAGIPVGALGVFGGAIGVGIGFGLQKLASNYVSGFVILAERSLRIGDQVKVDGFEGRITDIATRFTTVRAANGRESLVPNEMLISQRVENHTHADKHAKVSTVFEVVQGVDIERVIADLERALAGVPRVLADPAPQVHVDAIGKRGVTLAVHAWTDDQDNAQGSVRSAVNRCVLQRLQALGTALASSADG
jgi:small-conductance mechanosensitive channel